MQICRSLAGYSYARADLVRRAMSKKKTEVMAAEKEGFITGACERGVSKENAEEIFEEMVGFAKYAFNKSHATAYGLISYRTAYLKAHYPAEYYSALMTSVLDNTAKLREYIADADKFGIKVLPPDINLSDAHFTVSEGGIRYGLLAIRNVGVQFANAVVNNRSKAPYVSFDEFVYRLAGSDINKRTVESLIKCGAFDSLGVPRSVLLSCYEIIIDSEQERNRKNIHGQMDLFSMGIETEAQKGYKYPEGEEFPLKELLILEKESSGMYFSGHMIDGYSNHVKTLKTDSISDIILDGKEDNSAVNTKYKDRQTVRIAGIITSKRTKNVKNGDTMAFITVEDKLGEIEVIVFARQYAKLSSEIFEDNAVLIEGTLSLEDGEETKILLSKIEPLKSNTEFSYKAADKPKTEPRIYVKVADMSDRRITALSRIAMLNSGDVDVVIYDSATKKYSLLSGAKISREEKTLRRLYELFGEENVVLK